MKQLRLDFSDYSAEEQERDYQKKRFRQVYLMKVNGIWGHVTIVDSIVKYGFHNGDLTDTYNEIKTEFPTHCVRVIRNQGLENYLRDRMKPRKQAYNNAQQLKINFNQGGR